MALFEFLKTDSEGFLKTVRKWNPQLYNVGAVIKALMEELLLKHGELKFAELLQTTYIDKELVLFFLTRRRGSAACLGYSIHLSEVL